MFHLTCCRRDRSSNHDRVERGQLEAKDEPGLDLKRLLPRGHHPRTGHTDGVGVLPRAGGHDGRNQNGGGRIWCCTEHASMHEMIPLSLPLGDDGGRCRRSACMHDRGRR